MKYHEIPLNIMKCINNILVNISPWIYPNDYQAHVYYSKSNEIRSKGCSEIRCDINNVFTGVTHTRYAAGISVQLLD